MQNANEFFLILLFLGYTLSKDNCVVSMFNKLDLTIHGKAVTAKLMEDMWFYFCNGKEDNLLSLSPAFPKF